MTDRSIVEAAARLRRHGEPYLVATVVAVRGAATRRPGARLLLTRYRWVAGAVTGGCLEGDLAPSAWAQTQAGPIVRTFEARAPVADDDVRSAFGLGGDGEVDVLIERAGHPGRIDALEVVARCGHAQRRGAIATVIRGPRARPGARVALVAGGPLEAEGDALPPALAEALAADLRGALETGATTTRTYALPGGPVDALLEGVAPPPRLFVFGTGHDAVPVVQLARQLGWDALVVAAEPRHATRERFLGADARLLGVDEVGAHLEASACPVAVVLAHDLARERASLALLLPTRVRYVGLLGGRARAARLLAELGAGADPRVHALGGGEGLGPIDSPQELALALAAEIHRRLRPAPEPLDDAAREPAAGDRPAPSRASAGRSAVAAL